MKNFLRAFFVFASLVVAIDANAAERWTISAGTQFLNMPAAMAAAQAASGYTEPPNTHTCQAAIATTTGYQAQCQVYNSSGVSLGTPGKYFAIVTLSCTAAPTSTKISGTPPSCSCPSGKTWNAPNGICAIVCTSPLVNKPDGTCGPPCGADTRQLSGQSVITGAGLPQSIMCINYCNYALAGNGDPNQFSQRVLGIGNYSWTAKYQGNGTTCTATDSGISDDPAPDMVQDPATKNTSQWHKGDQCGYVNGKYYCTPSVASGKCAKSDTGEAMCNSPAGTAQASPPAPDNGTAGTPASPVASITQNSNTTNIYNSSTVTGSTAAVGSGTVVGTGTSNGPPGGSTTGGTTGSTGTQDVSTCGGDGQPACNSLGGGTDCTSPPSSAGDPIAGYQAMQEWKTACALENPPTDVVNAQIDAGLGTTTEGGLLHSKGSLDVSGWFDGAAQTGGGCPADIPVSLPQLNTSVNIPFANVCPYVTMIRTLGLILAALASLYIVQGAF